MTKTQMAYLTLQAFLESPFRLGGDFETPNRRADVSSSEVESEHPNSFWCSLATHSTFWGKGVKPGRAHSHAEP